MCPPTSRAAQAALSDVYKNLRAQAFVVRAPAANGRHNAPHPVNQASSVGYVSTDCPGSEV